MVLARASLSDLLIRDLELGIFKTMTTKVSNPNQVSFYPKRRFMTVHQKYTLSRSFFFCLPIFQKVSICWEVDQMDWSPTPFLFLLFMTSELQFHVWLWSSEVHQERVSEDDGVNWHSVFSLPLILFWVLCGRFFKYRMLLFKMPSGHTTLG